MLVLGRHDTPPLPVWEGHDWGDPPSCACDGCFREVGEGGKEKEDL